MDKDMTEDIMDGGSMDLEESNKARLRAVFPECFTEGRLDIDKLFSLCGEYITDDFERYEFRWKGKSECLKLAQTRSMGTLRPCREESVDWHSTGNLYIEGDNLEVLKLLQSSYYRKIKMIYIDPPYNTGNDFVYEDDFSDPIGRYKEVTSQTTKSNPETMGRFHTNWLNMMYPRLRLAANLLRDDGVIFISIDDNEVHNLRKLCDEVFGEENFVTIFPWRKRTAKSDVPFNVSQDYEWIAVYAKSDFFRAYGEKNERKYYETPDLPGRPWRIHDLTKQTSAAERPNSYFTIINPKNGNEYPANPNRTWAVTQETFLRYYEENRIVFPGDYDFLNISKPQLRYFKEDDEKKAGEMFGFTAVSTNLPSETGMSMDGTKDFNALFDNRSFGFPKPVGLIKYFLKIATRIDNDSLILDFFSGSGTTAQAVMELNAEDGGNRKFICVQLPEPCDEKSEASRAGYKDICEIGKERIRRAGKKIKENRGLEEFTEERPLDTGFKVFKLDSSNLKTWDPTPVDGLNIEELTERLNSMIYRIKSDRTDWDVVYEVMQKLGIPLTEKVKEENFSGKRAYCVYVGDACLLIMCLDKGLTTEIAEEMADKTPARIVFGQECFADITAMSNAKLALRDRDIEIKFV